MSLDNAQVPGLAEVARGLELLASSISGRNFGSIDARPTKITTLVDQSGKPSTWPTIRLYVLRRDDWTCQVCDGRADEVDHIHPRRWGGSDFLENLRAICGPCNKAKGASVDLQAATYGDICGGIDVVLERIRIELSTYLFPLISEIEARDLYEDEIPEGNARKVLDSVATEMARLESIVRSRVAL